MTDTADIVYVVHGSNAHTWWRRLANGGYPWWRRWSLFCFGIRRGLGRDCDLREFRWSGDNTHQARMAAASELAETIEKRSPGARVHVVGHSHGGNVALAAANLLPHLRIETLVLLANPHMATVDQPGAPPQWLYWGKATERVGCIWNLYSPEDFVQRSLARLFHGIRPLQGRRLLVRQTYGGTDYKGVQNAAVRWQSSAAAHRAMHCAAMGVVVGGLLGGKGFDEATAAAGISVEKPNEVGDRGGRPGVDETQNRIRDRGDPSPFDFRGANDRVGILFIHGFTASPAEMRPMAEYISKREGWRCRAILLPGHGTEVADMQKAGDDEWLAAAEAAFDDLSRECSAVFLAGMSLGAVICCHIALRRRSDARLRGLILLAPAFGISLDKAIALKILRPFRNLKGKGDRASDYFLDHKLSSYVQTPLNRAAEVLRLGRSAWNNLDKLKGRPTLMFAGDLESSVSLKKMHSAAGRNPWIRYVRLPRSRHILTVEPDRETLFDAAIRFVKECLKE